MNIREMVAATVAQAGTELRLTLRRGESVLITVIIPTALLVFFASARVLTASGRSIQFLLPGTIVLALISTGLVSLGIATAYERYYRVLKRFGSTPFPASGLIGAKILAVLALETVQILLLVLIAVFVYGWRPHGSLLGALAVVLLGTSTFAGLGLAMAGALRAEVTLAAANGLFLFFLLLGGLYVPLDHLPAVLVPLARALPAAPLASLLRAALGGTGNIAGSDVVLAVAWALGSPVVAIKVFRWD